VLVAIVKDKLVRFTKSGDQIQEDTILPLSLPLIEKGKSKVL